MADQSSPPGNRSGSDDLSDQFHPAYEFLNSADVDNDDDMVLDTETGAANPLIYFDVDVGVADDDDDDDVDYEVEEGDDDDDDDEEEDERPYVIGGGSASDDERILTMGAIIAQQTAHEDEEEEGDEEEDPRQSEGTSISHRFGFKLIADSQQQGQHCYDSSTPEVSKHSSDRTVYSLVALISSAEGEEEEGVMMTKTMGSVTDLLDLIGDDVRCDTLLQRCPARME
jgi:hypothetical protein